MMPKNPKFTRSRRSFGPLVLATGMASSTCSVFGPTKMRSDVGPRKSPTAAPNTSTEVVSPGFGLFASFRDIESVAQRDQRRVPRIVGNEDRREILIHRARPVQRSQEGLPSADGFNG